MSEENAIGIDYGDVVAGYRLDTSDFEKSINTITRGYGVIGAEVLALVATLTSADVSFSNLGAAALRAFTVGQAASRQFSSDLAGVGMAAAQAPVLLAEVEQQVGKPECTYRQAHAVCNENIVSDFNLHHSVSPADSEKQPSVSSARLPATEITAMDRRVSYRESGAEMVALPRGIVEMLLRDQHGRGGDSSEEQRAHMAVPPAPATNHFGAYEQYNHCYAGQQEIIAILTGEFAGLLGRFTSHPSAGSAENDAWRMAAPVGRNPEPGPFQHQLPYSPARLPATQDAATADVDTRLPECYREEMQYLFSQSATNNRQLFTDMHEGKDGVLTAGVEKGSAVQQSMPLFAGTGMIPLPLPETAPSRQEPLRLEVTVKAGQNFTADVSAIADQRIELVVLPALQRANR